MDLPEEFLDDPTFVDDEYVEDADDQLAIEGSETSEDDYSDDSDYIDSDYTESSDYTEDYEYF